MKKTGKNKEIIYFIEGKEYRIGEVQKYFSQPQSVLEKLPKSVLLIKAGSFIFNYVGLIIIDNQSVIVLPKYFLSRVDSTWALPDYTKQHEARLLMQVLRQCSKKLIGNLAEISEREEDTFFDGQISVALDLIDNYVEYGYWQKTEEVISIGASSHINWQRTLERTTPLISDGTVIYPDTYTSRRQTIENSLILQIHRWAIRYCIETYGVIFPELDGVWYDPESVDNLDELGDDEYLLGVLVRELRISYRDNQIRLLELLILLIDKHQKVGKSEQVVLFGAFKFHVVWEEACKKVFGDKSGDLEERLPVPLWQSLNGNKYLNKKHRQIPDAFWYDKRHLLIIDAKYYVIGLGKSPDDDGNLLLYDSPGGPDVLKQLAYQSSLCSLLKIPPESTMNAFVIPRTDSQSPVNEIKEWFWGYINSQLPVEEWRDYRITVLLVPPRQLFEIYLGKRKPIDQLELIEWNNKYKFL